MKKRLRTKYQFIGLLAWLISLIIWIPIFIYLTGVVGLEDYIRRHNYTIKKDKNLFLGFLLSLALFLLLIYFADLWIKFKERSDSAKEKQNGYKITNLLVSQALLISITTTSLTVWMLIFDSFVKITKLDKYFIYRVADTEIYFRKNDNLYWFSLVLTLSVTAVIISNLLRKSKITNISEIIKYLKENNYHPKKIIEGLNNRN